MKIFSAIRLLYQTICRTAGYLHYSLQLRLGVAFVAALVVSAVLVGAVAFYDNYQQSHYWQDQTLVQIATYVDPTYAAPFAAEQTNDAHIYVLTSAGGGWYEGIGDIRALPEGFSRMSDGDDDYRVFVLDKLHGRVAVVQETEYRTEVAWRAAWAGVFPFLWLTPVFMVLAYIIIKQNLKPIKVLSNGLKARQAHDLSPLNTNKIPSEIVGFVDAINALFVRIENAMGQQQRFIADAAHELRSPMTALSIQAERLAAMPLSDEVKQQSDSILKGIRRNRHLLEQLLSLARVQAEEGVQMRTQFSVQSVFTQVIEMAYPVADAKDIDIGILEQSEVYVWADKQAFFSLIKVFVDNAVHYTPKGGQVDLSASLVNDELVMIIEDSGIGIPKHEQGQVFEPFYRVLGTQVEGTGLGLSIARSIVERYDGKITLQDSTTFKSGLKVQIIIAKDKLQP